MKRYLTLVVLMFVHSIASHREGARRATGKPENLLLILVDLMSMFAVLYFYGWPR